MKFKAKLNQVQTTLEQFQMLVVKLLFNWQIELLFLRNKILSKMQIKRHKNKVVDAYNRFLGKYHKFALVPCLAQDKNTNNEWISCKQLSDHSITYRKLHFRKRYCRYHKYQMERDYHAYHIWNYYDQSKMSSKEAAQMEIDARHYYHKKYQIWIDNKHFNRIIFLKRIVLEEQSQENLHKHCLRNGEQYP